MRKQSIIHRLRILVAGAFGIKSQDAGAGNWWEIDLIIVILGGLFLLGIAALIKL